MVSFVHVFFDNYICISMLSVTLVVQKFQVFNCPIREDSAKILSELKNSSHDLVSNVLKYLDSQYLQCEV